MYHSHGVLTPFFTILMVNYGEWPPFVYLVRSILGHQVVSDDVWNSGESVCKWNNLPCYYDGLEVGCRLKLLLAVKLADAHVHWYIFMV